MPKPQKDIVQEAEQKIKDQVPQTEPKAVYEGHQPVVGDGVRNVPGWLPKNTGREQPAKAEPAE